LVPVNLSLELLVIVNVKEMYSNLAHIQITKNASFSKNLNSCGKNIKKTANMVIFLLNKEEKVDRQT